VTADEIKALLGEALNNAERAESDLSSILKGIPVMSEEDYDLVYEAVAKLQYTESRIWLLCTEIKDRKMPEVWMGKKGARTATSTTTQKSHATKPKQSQADKLAEALKAAGIDPAVLQKAVKKT